jgi:hypothetical protein
MKTSGDSTDKPDSEQKSRQDVSVFSFAKKIVMKILKYSHN